MTTLPVPTLETIKYRCRFCQVQRSFECDVSAQVIGGVRLNLKKWTANMCCNRCSEHYVDRQKLTRRIGGVCYALKIARGNPTSQLTNIEAACRIKLNGLLKEFNSLIARHYYRDDIFDEQITSDLLSAPDKVETLLRVLTNAIRGQLALTSE